MALREWIGDVLAGLLDSKGSAKKATVQREGWLIVPLQDPFKRRRPVVGAVVLDEEQLRRRPDLALSLITQVCDAVTSPSQIRHGVEEIDGWSARLLIDDDPGRFDDPAVALVVTASDATDVAGRGLTRSFIRSLSVQRLREKAPPPPARPRPPETKFASVVLAMEYELFARKRRSVAQVAERFDISIQQARRVLERFGGERTRATPIKDLHRLENEDRMEQGLRPLSPERVAGKIHQLRQEDYLPKTRRGRTTEGLGRKSREALERQAQRSRDRIARRPRRP